MAVGVNACASALICKCCISRVSSAVKSSTCNCMFHNNCAELYYNLKMPEKKNYIVCCDKVLNEPIDSVDFYVAISEMVTTDKKVDAHIYRYIIKQKDILIAEMRDKIAVLNT